MANEKQINQSKYDAYNNVNLAQTKQKLLEEAEKKYPGVSTNYFIDDLCNIDSLINDIAGELHFRQSILKNPIPYDQKVFDSFIKMNKYPVGQEFFYTDITNGKNVFGMYLLGYDEKTNKQVLYSLSAVINNINDGTNPKKNTGIKIKETGNNLLDFDISIKLDVCTQLQIPSNNQLKMYQQYKADKNNGNQVPVLNPIQSKEVEKLDTGAWMSLARLDTSYIEHPDYPTGTIIVGPHLHINSEENVIRSSQDTGYMRAVAIKPPQIKTDNLSKKELIKNLSYLIQYYMNIFSKQLNIDISLNKAFTDKNLNNENKTYLPNNSANKMFNFNESASFNFTPDLLLMDYLERNNEKQF